MSWTWEYAFSVVQAARTAPRSFDAQVDCRAAELVRPAEASYALG
ncbi:hypothetical protein [Streptomyces himalayensis]|nr:hypothetical protein [Streptomyces himalayensis]